MDRVTHQITFFSPKSLDSYNRPSTQGCHCDRRPRGRKSYCSRIPPLESSNYLFHPTFHNLIPRTIALEAHRRGREVILHLPMEPHGYPEIQPGEGALLQEMDEESLIRQLSKDIEAIPYIKGVSNHMGSRLMEDSEKMRIIFSELKRRGLFFLDSRTTPQTVGLQTAHEIGLMAMERTLFLDNSPDEDDIKQNIERLTQFSLFTGKAIAIGHPHSSTLKSLKEMIPKMKEKGIDIVPLSALME